MPWGAEQDKALKALVEFVTSLPILALPDWEATFLLHTDVSELGVGEALTQDTRGTERVSDMRATDGQRRMPSSPRLNER